MTPECKLRTAWNPGKGFSRNLNEFRGKEIEEEKGVRVCVCMRERDDTDMSLCQCMCIPVFPGVQVLKRLVFFVESILQGSGTCVSLCKLSSWSPLWESLAVKLILLSHTPVSVPHLSAQPQGPSCSLLHTWLCFLLLSDFKAPRAGCSHRNWAT